MLCMKVVPRLIRFTALLVLTLPAAAGPILSPSTTVHGGIVTATDFVAGTVGELNNTNNWPEGEPPADLVNGIIGGGGDKYLNFAVNNTAVVFTNAAARAANRLELWVANDSPERDPASYRLYGTNAAIGTPGPGSTLALSTFALISSGPLALPDTRDETTDATGFSQSITFPNATAYTSYLLVFPTVKGPGANSMQLSEVQLSDDRGIIGVDSFDYPDGIIAGQAGGTFWDCKNTSPTGHTGVKSTWDDISLGGSATISGGRLVTHNHGWAKREYNGASETEGAVNDTNVAKAVYARVTVTTGATLPNYFGLASYDFGAERMFVGKRIGSSTFGYQIEGGTNANGSVTVPASATFTLVFRLDFVADTISLYLDPDLNRPMSDPDNVATVVSTATYTGTNWSTALRLASGSGGDPVAWDDLVVATAWDDLGTVVTTDSDEDNGDLSGGTVSLREAVKYSPEGTLITFDSRISGRTIAITTDPILIERALTIDATALPSGLVLDGLNARTIMTNLATGPVTLRGLTFTRGNGAGSPFGDAAGAFLGGFGTQTTISRCTFFGNTAINAGGAILCAGDMTVTDSTFYDNTAASEGGAIYAFGDGILTVTGCTITANRAAGFGGGIRVNGESSTRLLTLRHSTICHNTSAQSDGGGGIDIVNAAATLENSIVWGNTSLGAPGDLFIEDTDFARIGANIVGRTRLFAGDPQTGPEPITSDPKLSPLGWFGGPVQTLHPLIGSPAIDAAGTTNPGGTDARGFPRIVDGDANESAHLDIGAVEAGPLLRVTTAADITSSGSLRSRIAQAAEVAGTRIGFAVPEGAAVPLILNHRGELAVPATANGLFIDASDRPVPFTISGNNASRVFSIPSGATVAMHSLKIRSGRVDEFNIGGGIMNDGTCTVIACTVSGNHAGGGGGGIANSGTCAVIASTFDGNTVLFNGGGGIANYNTCTVTNSTFTGNTAFFGGGGGIFNNNTCTVISSTLSGNPSDDGNGGGISTSGTFRLVSSVVAGNTGGEITGTITGPNNLTSGDPLLAPLGDYGGPTQTMALRPGSPARNAGVASARMTDQRGFPIVGLPDIGAYEAGTLAPNYNAFIQETLPATATDPQHAPGFDYDGDGADNHHEWLALTLPADPASRFRVTNFSKTGDTFSVSFPTVFGRTYQLQSSPNLANPWTNVGSPTPGTGSSVTLTPAPVPGFTRYFFRVSVGP